MKVKCIIPTLFMLIFSAAFVMTYRAMEGATTECITEEEIEYTYLSPYIELSPYDNTFREAADTLGFDWTLVAAIAFVESRFDSTAVSGAGARGVMQLMPSTLRAFKVPDSLGTKSYYNIMTATKLLQTLDKYYKRIEQPRERLNFILAAYNAGHGHVTDAMRLAEKYGYNKYKWEDNVEDFLKHKSQPKYYSDKLCRCGRFTGWRETQSFVKKVIRTWDRYAKAQAEYTDSVTALTVADKTIKIGTIQ
jgi:membrane-bound lytic murein transglycosylase F